VAPGRYILCAEPRALGISGENTSPNRERFLRTCYPSAGSEQTAEPIRLERGDSGEFRIVMRRGRTMTISGTVVDSTGAPAPHARVALNRFEISGTSGTGVMVPPDGRFKITNVHPGEYALSRGHSDRIDRRQWFISHRPPTRR
jgi:protocatechuate 3,4-dioxygenase beta subunit